MAPHSPSVLVAGSLSVDSLESPGGTCTRMGGVVTYASLTFGALGLGTSVVCRLCPDDQHLAQKLADPSIRVHWEPTAHTTRFVHRTSGDARESWMPEKALPIQSCVLQRHLGSIGHVHLGPLHPDDLEAALLTSELLRTRTVTLDIQGYVRRIEGGRVTGFLSERLTPALHAAQYAKASREEVELVCSTWGISEQRLLEAHGLRELVVTCGSRGGYVRSGSGQVQPFAAAAPAHVSDTTGAGDVFFAAYLAHRVHGGDTVQGACGAAARIAGQHVAGQWLSPGRIELP